MKIRLNIETVTGSKYSSQIAKVTDAELTEIREIIENVCREEKFCLTIDKNSDNPTVFNGRNLVAVEIEVVKR